MMLVKSLTVASLLLGTHGVAFAEDDLMSILEGKTSQAAAQFVESEEVAKLKKAVNPSSAEQNIFFQFLVEKNYEKAMFQWSTAFNGSAFQATETGKALEAFLNFKNGLKLTGVESLLAIQNPQKIDATVISLWKENLNDKDPVWGMAQVTWNPYWTTVFGTGAEMAVVLQKSYVTEDIAALTELIKKTPVDSVERNILQWQLVLNLGIRGDAGKAAQVLAHLMKAKNNPIDKDLMTITAGRLLYQNGFLDASLKYYEKISKKSDYWFQAQEEMAWAYMRKGEPQNAMAITKTLTYPHFKGWVGIESYLLGSFSSLKVCDYPGVLTTMKSIKTQFGEHLVALEKLSTDPHQPAVANLMKALSEGPVSTAKLGKDAHQLPTVASKDEVLSLLVKRHQYLMKESEIAEQLYTRSLTFGNLQGQYETLKNQVQTRAQMTQGAGYQRVQELAKAELEDSKQVMQRLRIVEVEMIQQVDSASKFLKHANASEAKMGSTGSGAKFAMNFSNDKEIWFDELSNFKVDVKKGCSKGKE
ncbi:tetratricopeptide repeat protein [Bdellovibrio sp. HCB-162]|uniref:tetratricopeptide repeat protein n=1 Tax=Bdellovibrio sp. HCB-162 TaxID=3394234 RepID=UPI0039BD0A13